MSEKSSPSGRAIFKGISAATISMAALLPATANVVANPDAELLVIGAEFERLYADYVPCHSDMGRFAEIFDLIIAEEKKKLGRDLCLNNKADEALWEKLRIDCGYEGAICKCDAILNRIIELTNEALKLPAATIGGLAVKARLAQHACHLPEEIEQAPRDQDWDVFVLNELVKDLQCLASLAIAIGGANAQLVGADRRA
jgi:hypothetical protein